jgi:hypothetical protein
MKKLVFVCSLAIVIFALNFELTGWGFWGHQRINQKAVYCLPQPLLQFYKANIDFITKHAVDPDMRRYADPEEAPRHYIDLDRYGDHPFDSLPIFWKDAIRKIGEDTLKAHGIVPYHIQTMLYRLTNAFKEKNTYKILKYSAEIGHYIGDAHVPLHCTRNYNGQLTGQHGIHGFWESRIPEMLGNDYNYLVGRSLFVEHPVSMIWQTLSESYAAKDSVLLLEEMLNKQFNSDKKYSYEVKGRQVVKVYSKEYTKAYNNLLNGMVERRMRKAIFITASFWYTAWVNAGMPDVNSLDDKEVLQSEIKDSINDSKNNNSVNLFLKGHDD